MTSSAPQSLTGEILLVKKLAAFRQKVDEALEKFTMALAIYKLEKFLVKNYREKPGSQ